MAYKEIERLGNKIKNLAKHYRVLVYNFSFLSLNQIASYIFPLITLPYLVRVFGPRNYGLINFIAAFIAYFGIITDYGFNYSATKLVATNRENKIKISQIYFSVIIIKSILLIISLMILVICLETIPFFYIYRTLYLLTFLTIVGQILLPNWFFLGMEKMKYIVTVNLVYKSLFVIGVFLFVKNSTDLELYIVMNSLTFVFIGLTSQAIVFVKFKIKFLIPNYIFIKQLLIEGWHIFISMLSITLYTNTNSFILGIIAGNEAVGFYTAADKLRIAFQNFVSVIGQTIFPHVSMLFQESYEKGINFVKKTGSKFGISILLVNALLFVFAPQIIETFVGKNFQKSIDILRILSFLPLLVFFSNLFGIQTMLNINMQKEFSHIIIWAGALNILLSLILVPLFQEIGTSISVLVTELFVTLGMMFYLFYRKVFYKVE